MSVLDVIQSEFSSTFEANPPEIVAVRLIASIVLGGIIGVEREVNAEGAGLRTHILVSLASCLFALIVFELLADHGGTNSDPLRLIEAVTSGVAFLAAGSIITSGGRVKGLTTGAGMWMAGAVGLACGIGNIPLAALAAFLGLIVLWVFQRASRRLNNIGKDQDVTP